MYAVLLLEQAQTFLKLHIPFLLSAIIDQVPDDFKPYKEISGFWPRIWKALAGGRRAVGDKS